MDHNPFYYGGIVGSEHFCNRKKEIEELLGDIRVGLNVLLYAPRRFGKTSLVLKTLQSQNINYVFVDLLSVVDSREFIQEYFNAISQSFKSKGEKFMDFIKKSLGFRPNFVMEFDTVGNPSFRLGFQARDSNSVLKEVLDLPWKCAEHKNERFVVVFDEFQEVVNLKIEDKLRSAIQHHGNRVSYIFLGSKKSIMKNLFFNKSKPFYKSVKHISIDKIATESWIQYIQDGFQSRSKSITQKHIHELLKVSQGFPYYTQQLAYEVFNFTTKSTTDTILKEAVQSVLNKEEDFLLGEWENLSQLQKKALKLLVYSQGENIYSRNIMEEFRFTSSSLKKAIEGLLSKDVIDNKNGIYYFQDPLMEYWLQTRMG